MNLFRIAGLAGLTLALAAFGGKALDRDEGFDHWKHRKLFPSCETCHAGARDATQPLYPDQDGCASCHDGKTLVDKKPLKEVKYQRPTQLRLVTNLRFTHEEHIKEVFRKKGADSTLTCLQCHGKEGAQWMQVAERPVQDNCMSCHGLKVAHFSAPDRECGKCHVTLAEAKDVPRERIAKFPEPESHKAPDFKLAKGHGELAKPPEGGRHPAAVAQSCATCHARDFCAQCHVNAPEVKLIQALAPDERSLAIEAKLEEPQSHKDANFQARHGGLSKKGNATCANCHTQQSCLACHRATPAVAVKLSSAGADRGQGAQIERKRPVSHTANFADTHGPLAKAEPKSCTACHARVECLDCHRPNPGSADSYHPAGFLARHPASAYNRQTDCAECHNQQAFCTQCHLQSGFGSNNGLLTGKFHDSKGSFLLGHGQAARLNIESCITCHSEKDCLACHSARTRRFNPHGPDFDADRLRKKNPQTCSACHGRAIPN